MISSLSKFQLLISSYDYENYATKISTFHLRIYVPTLPRCHLPELNFWKSYLPIHRSNLPRFHPTSHGFPSRIDFLTSFKTIIFGNVYQNYYSTQNLPVCIEEAKDTIDSPTTKINYCWKLYSSIFCSQSLLLKYHNCKPRGISNQYYPVLNNVQDFTFEMFSEFLRATMVVLCSLWATRTLLSKKMNSLFATYSPEQPTWYLYLLWATRALPLRGWSTTMFIILCEQPTIFLSQVL